MIPEHRSQLRKTVDELKRVVAGCMGDDHESVGVIAQIERTIVDIEQKVKAMPVSDIANQITGKDDFAIGSPAPSASLSL